MKRDATLAGSLIDALCRAGQKDDFIDPKDALPIISKRTLCVVVDTYQVGLVESKEILEKCGKVAVIDHHRKGVGYIQNPDLVCHEPYSSSASELVTELLQYVGDRDDKPNRVKPRACSPASCWTRRTLPCTPACVPLKPLRPCAVTVPRRSGCVSCLT